MASMSYILHHLDTKNGNATVSKDTQGQQRAFMLRYPYIEPSLVPLEGLPPDACIGGAKNFGNLRLFCQQRHRAMIAPDWRAMLESHGKRHYGDALISRVDAISSTPPTTRRMRFTVLSALRRIEAMDDAALYAVADGWPKAEVIPHLHSPIGHVRSDAQATIAFALKHLVPRREFSEAAALLWIAQRQPPGEASEESAAPWAKLLADWLEQEGRYDAVAKDLIEQRKHLANGQPGN